METRAFFPRMCGRWCWFDWILNRFTQPDNDYVRKYVNHVYAMLAAMQPDMREDGMFSLSPYCICTTHKHHCLHVSYDAAKSHDVSMWMRNLWIMFKFHIQHCLSPNQSTIWIQMFFVCLFSATSALITWHLEVSLLSSQHWNLHIDYWNEAISSEFSFRRMNARSPFLCSLLLLFSIWLPPHTVKYFVEPLAVCLHISPLWLSIAAIDMWIEHSLHLMCEKNAQNTMCDRHTYRETQQRPPFSSAPDFTRIVLEQRKPGTRYTNPH